MTILIFNLMLGAVESINGSVLRDVTNTIVTFARTRDADGASRLQAAAYWWTRPEGTYARRTRAL